MKIANYLFLILLFPLVCFSQSKDSIFSFLSYDKVKIAFTDEGKGEPVLLLHGFIASGNSWNNTVLKKELLQQGYRVIIPDLRGNGNSGKPQNSESYANDAEIADLILLADYLKLESYYTVGYSRGSIVLAKLLTKDFRIKKAVIGGIGLDFTNPNWNRRILFADAFSGRSELTSETSGAVNYAKSIGADLSILSFLQDHQPITSVAELGKIIIKILIIAGNLDKDNGNPEELQRALPNSKLQIISGDHNNAYKSEQFSKAIIQFLTID